MKAFIVLAAAFALAACSVGPGYEEPDVAPIVLASPQAAAFAAVGARGDAAWWQFFDDPQLARLVDHALVRNHDVRQAHANLLLARAGFDAQDLERYPLVTSAAAYQRSLAQQAVDGERPARSLVQSWRAGLDLHWELDLFGRLDHLSRAAQARVEASRAELRQVQLSIAAEVARAYFDARGQQHQLALAQDEVRSWRETVRLVEARLLAGSGLPEDRESALGNLLRAEASIAPLQSRLQRSLYRLDVLCAERPGSLAVDLGEWQQAPLARRLPLGDVDRLIRNRPDVLRAERLLAARVEEVGAATANLYPRIDLGGFIGFFALRDGDLGSASRAFDITPGLTWPALDLGRVRARLRAAQARSAGEAVQFEQVVLRAIEEVEGAVVQLTEHQRHLQALVRSAQHGEAAFAIASRRYDAGGGSYQAVLESQRELLRMRQAIVQAQTASYRNAVALYKALAWRGTSET